MQHLTVKSIIQLTLTFCLFLTATTPKIYAQTIDLLAHFELEGAIYLPYDDNKDYGRMKVQLEINNANVSTGEIVISAVADGDIDADTDQYIVASGVLSTPSNAEGWNTVNQSFTMPFSLTLDKKTRFEVVFSLANRNEVKLLFSDALGYTQAASGLTLTQITLDDGVTSLADAGYEFTLDPTYTQLVSEATAERTIYKDKQLYPTGSSVTETSINTAASLDCNGTDYLFNFQATPKESHTHTINHAKARIYTKTSNCILTEIVE